MEVDFYLRTRVIFIDGHKSDVKVALKRRLGTPDVLTVDDREVPKPWTLRLHCGDGTIQTIEGVDW